MSHSVEILRSAQKSLAKIQGEDRERVIGAIRMLGKVPKPKGVRKLSGRPAWRIRVGNYRVI